MTLPLAAFAAALVGLDHMTTARLRALLRVGSADQLWQALTTDHRTLPGLQRHDPALLDVWRRAARSTDVDLIWQHCQRQGISVLMASDDAFPSALATDRAAPVVLFAMGDVHLLHGRRVALVGTRNPTAVGRHQARRFGAELASHGVHVVSGLARGVDGCAHRGVLESGPGRPIAVVGTGIDHVYPAEHAGLWRQVAEHGLLLSEAPCGAGPLPFRFPQRNRILAALSELVVVIESRERGGSLITVTEAAERGIPVMAMPGALNNRAAVGTNELIRDGAAVAASAADVLTALDIEHRGLWDPGDRRPMPRRDDIDTYRVCVEQARTLEGIALATSRTVVDAAMSVARLESDGWITQLDGWYETVGATLHGC